MGSWDREHSLAGSGKDKGFKGRACLLPVLQREDRPLAAVWLMGLGARGRVMSELSGGQEGQESVRDRPGPQTHMGPARCSWKGRDFSSAFERSRVIRRTFRQSSELPNVASPRSPPNPKPAVAEGRSCWERMFSPPCHFIEFSRAFYF